MGTTSLSDGLDKTIEWIRKELMLEMSDKMEVFGVLTAVKKNMDVVKGQPESKHVAVIKLKKPAYDKDENLKPGTGAHGST